MLGGIQVFLESVQKHVAPIEQTRQVVHIPTVLLGVRNGTYTRQMRAVSERGTVWVQFGWDEPEEVSYGICRYAKQEIMLIRGEGDEHWQGIDALPV